MCELWCVSYVVFHTKTRKKDDSAVERWRDEFDIMRMKRNNRSFFSHFRATQVNCLVSIYTHTAERWWFFVNLCPLDFSSTVIAVCLLHKQALRSVTSTSRPLAKEQNNALIIVFVGFTCLLLLLLDPSRRPEIDFLSLSLAAVEVRSVCLFFADFMLAFLKKISPSPSVHECSVKKWNHNKLVPTTKKFEVGKGELSTVFGSHVKRWDGDSLQLRPRKPATHVRVSESAARYRLGRYRQALAGQ